MDEMNRRTLENFREAQYLIRELETLRIQYRLLGLSITHHTLF